MKTTDFSAKLTSTKLKENMNKMFGVNVNFEKYSREQLEDMRNKIRTRVFQLENSSGMTDLLTNETYQKDKAMLALLNTRIKEMLGEDIAKLRDKLAQLDEAKKGVKAPKYKIHAKGTAAKDYDGDGKVETPKDEVWGSRAKAAAKAGKPFGEEMEVDEGSKHASRNRGASRPGSKEEADKGVERKREMKAKYQQSKEKDKPVGENRVVKGTRYGGSKQKDDDSSSSNDTPAKGSSEKSAADRAKDKAMDKAQSQAGKDWEARGYKRTIVKGKSQSGSKDDDLDEAKKKPSAGMTKKEKSAVVKKAKAGGDIGKPGKGFKDVEAAAKKGGAKDPKAVAAAAMWKKQAKENFARNVKIVNESLSYLLYENEEEKAKAITAAGDMVNDYTSWMQRVGQFQTKSMIELADSIRQDFGAAESEAFKQAVGPALQATLEVLMAQREAISNAVASLAGEALPPGEQMGAEPAADMAPEEPGMEPSEPDMMNEPTGDEFAASDAAAGAGTTGREMRESRIARKLAEGHSIIAKLAR